MIALDPGQFELVRETSWEEVFADWRDKEAGQEKWISVYTQRGFESWDEWRSEHMKPLALASRRWFLYRIVTPHISIPEFYGGPFQTWREEYYEGKDIVKFADLVQQPAIQAREDLKDLIRNFPAQTSLIGIVQKGRIVITEGMHRCCAVALAAQTGEPLRPEMTIALTDFGQEQVPLLRRVTKSG